MLVHLANDKYTSLREFYKINILNIYTKNYDFKLYLVTFADGDRGSVIGISILLSVMSIKGTLEIFFARRWMLLILTVE